MTNGAPFPKRESMNSCRMTANLRDRTPEGKKPPARWWHRCTMAIAAVVLSGCASGVHVKDTTRTFDTVVIDAGHGGHDDGTKSRWGGREKNNTLDVALR